jgi:hypothetical protein
MNQQATGVCGSCWRLELAAKIPRRRMQTGCRRMIFPRLVAPMGLGRRRNRSDGAAQKMPADPWFDFKGSDRFEVTEQSFLLPEEEILTVLALPDAAVA